MNTSKAEIYRDVRGLYRWRLKAGNGEIVAQGESYSSRSNATAAVERIKSTFAMAVIVDIY